MCKGGRERVNVCVFVFLIEKMCVERKKIVHGKRIVVLERERMSIEKKKKLWC